LGDEGRDLCRPEDALGDVVSVLAAVAVGVSADRGELEVVGGVALGAAGAVAGGDGTECLGRSAGQWMPRRLLVVAEPFLAVDGEGGRG
jgi:uncharacterized protein (DUF697 family)